MIMLEVYDYKCQPSHHCSSSTSMFEGRSLQLRPEQLTVSNIAKAFRLIEETIMLVSERGTIAVATDGTFHDVNRLDLWTVQGDKATGPRIVGSQAAACTSVPKWRPQSFPPPVRSSSGAGPSRQVSCKAVATGVRSLYVEPPPPPIMIIHTMPYLLIEPPKRTFKLV